jgi:hypothetical protein
MTWRQVGRGLWSVAKVLGVIAVVAVSIIFVGGVLMMGIVGVIALAALRSQAGAYRSAHGWAPWL